MLRKNTAPVHPFTQLEKKFLKYLLSPSFITSLLPEKVSKYSNFCHWKKVNVTGIYLEILSKHKKVCRTHGSGAAGAGASCFSGSVSC